MRDDYKRDLILHFFEDYFSFDNKILRTSIVLLTQPGQLTVEFMAEKRAKYVPPLRLYLFIAFICMLGLSYMNHLKPDSFDSDFSVEFSFGGNGSEEETLDNNFAKSLGENFAKAFKEKSSLIVLLEISLFSFFIYLGVAEKHLKLLN